MKKTREEIEQIAEVVVDAMLKVHRGLGAWPAGVGYQACLAHELRCRRHRGMSPVIAVVLLRALAPSR